MKGLFKMTVLSVYCSELKKLKKIVLEMWIRKVMSSFLPPCSSMTRRFAELVPTSIAANIVVIVVERMQRHVRRVVAKPICRQSHRHLQANVRNVRVSI